MPMDKNKLAAYAKGGGGNPPKGNPSPPPKEEPEEEELDEEAENGGEPEGLSDELVSKYGPLVELLEMHAEQIEEQYDLLDPEMVTDLSVELDDGEKQAVMATLDLFEQELADALREHTPGMEEADAAAIADHLVEHGSASDAEMLAGYLVRLGQSLGGNAEEPDPNEAMPEGEDPNSDY